LWELPITCHRSRFGPASGTTVANAIRDLPKAVLECEVVLAAWQEIEPKPDTGHGAQDFTSLFRPPASAPKKEAPPTPDEVEEHISHPSEKRRPVVIFGAAAAAVTGILVALLFTWKTLNPTWLIVASALLVITGIAMGFAVRHYAAARRDQLTGGIDTLLQGAQTRKALSMTLSLQVDQVIKKCRQMDERFLGLTMAVMVKEYDSARKFDDRQKALMNAIAYWTSSDPSYRPGTYGTKNSSLRQCRWPGSFRDWLRRRKVWRKLARGTP
jgi:hypothetical protein